MSLYTKYRPKTLEELKGNAALKKTLNSYFKRPDHNHCCLFYGNSGCGKTTIARAIATSILGADELSITEINASSDNGIDMTRQVQEACANLPFSAKHSVFIIDECHNLTGQAKGSLLKTCEDIPPHVYIFFCTTNRDAFLKGSKGETTNALSTRCTQFKLEPLNNDDACKLLDEVIVAENCKCISDNVFYKIVEVSEGSSRLILVNLEKVMDETLTDEERLAALVKPSSEVDNEDVRQLMKTLLSGAQWNTIAPIIKKIKPIEEPVSLSKAIMSYMNSVLLNGFSPHAASILQNLEKHIGNIYTEGWPVFTLAILEGVS